MAGVSTGVSLLTGGRGVSVITSAIEYSSTCVRGDGSDAPGQCRAYVTVYFTITNNSVAPSAISFAGVSGSSGIIVQSSSYNASGGWVRGYWVMFTGNSPTSFSNIIRVFIGSAFVNSAPFLLNFNSSAAPVLPSVSFATPSSASCSFQSPDTTCNTSTTASYSVSSYVDGTLTAERVSGSTDITATRVGSDSNGYIAFSAAVSGATSAVFRLKLVATSGTYYSANRTVSFSATEIPLLLVWHDFNASSSTYPNAHNTAQYVQGVSGFQSNSGSVNATLDYFHNYNPSPHVVGNAIFSYLSSNRPWVGNSFTVCAWLYSGSSAQVGTIAEDYLRIISIDTDIEIRLCGGDLALYANSFIRLNTRFLEGTWRFITLTFENVSGSSYVAKMYIDGSLAASSASFSYSFSLNAVIGFSGHNFTLNQSVGAPRCRIDSLGIYNKILGAGEMAYLYNAGAGRTYADTIK